MVGHYKGIKILFLVVAIGTFIPVVQGANPMPAGESAQSARRKKMIAAAITAAVLTGGLAAYAHVPQIRESVNRNMSQAASAAREYVQGKGTAAGQYGRQAAGTVTSALGNAASAAGTYMQGKGNQAMTVAGQYGSQAIATVGQYAKERAAQGFSSLARVADTLGNQGVQTTANLVNYGVDLTASKIAKRNKAALMVAGLGYYLITKTQDPKTQHIPNQVAKLASLLLTAVITGQSLSRLVNYSDSVVSAAAANRALLEQARGAAAADALGRGLRNLLGN